MNKKLLLLPLIALVLSFVTTNVSASSEIWYHDLGKDVGSQTLTNYAPYLHLCVLLQR
jgi:hypothetical protein